MHFPSLCVVVLGKAEVLQTPRPAPASWLSRMRLERLLFELRTRESPPPRVSSVGLPVSQLVATKDLDSLLLLRCQMTAAVALPSAPVTVVATNATSTNSPNSNDIDGLHVHGA